MFKANGRDIEKPELADENGVNQLPGTVRGMSLQSIQSPHQEQLSVQNPVEAFERLMELRSRNRIKKQRRCEPQTDDPSKEMLTQQQKRKTMDELLKNFRSCFQSNGTIAMPVHGKERIRPCTTQFILPEKAGSLLADGLGVKDVSRHENDQKNRVSHCVLVRGALFAECVRFKSDGYCGFGRSR